MTRDQAIKRVHDNGVEPRSRETLETWLDILERAGLCVIQATASEAEVHRVSKAIWDAREELFPAKTRMKWPPNHNPEHLLTIGAMALAACESVRKR